MGINSVWTYKMTVEIEMFVGLICIVNEALMIKIVSDWLTHHSSPLQAPVRVNLM